MPSPSTLLLGEEAVHLRRRGVVVGVVVGAEEAALAEEPLLVAALALRVGLGVEVGVEVKLGDEGARRQRDDASELGEALVLGGHELARALDRRRVLQTLCASLSLTADCTVNINSSLKSQNSKLTGLSLIHI